jgi:hypothetical protein
MLPPWEGPPAEALERLGFTCCSPWVRLRPPSAGLRLVASWCLGSWVGGYLGDPVVNTHEVGFFSNLGDDFASTDPLSLPCYCGDRHEALLRSGVQPVGDLIQGLAEVPNGESLSETSMLFATHPVAVTPGVLVVSSLIRGCVVDTSSSKMSSRYRSCRVSEGPVSPAAMKTWRSGVQRSESEVATSVEVSSSFGASGVPSWKGSESR